MHVFSDLLWETTFHEHLLSVIFFMTSYNMRLLLHYMTYCLHEMFSPGCRNFAKLCGAPGFRGMCLITFLAFTLKFPIQTVLSVVPTRSKLCDAPGFWENVLDSFSCFYIEIAYSKFTFCGTYTLSFLVRHTILSKTGTPPVVLKDWSYNWSFYDFTNCRPCVVGCSILVVYT